MNGCLLLLKRQTQMFILICKIYRKSVLRKLSLLIERSTQLGTNLTFLADVIKDNTDILMISGSKLGDSFPDSQLLIEGFGRPLCLDRNRNSGGIMLFIRSDIRKFLC